MLGRTKKNMKILGIETSCDETACSVVENGTRVLAESVTSSQKMHAATGGIIPENAAREQIKAILPVISGCADTEFLKEEIDAIAVTIGPGLIGSLLVGVETAKVLSYIYNKPIIPVNHLIGHIYSNFILEEYQNGRIITYKNNPPSFPIVAMIVSGGHTELAYMAGHASLKKSTIQVLGGTRDDAAGEAFDKTARILGLPYPGGVSISKASFKFRRNNPGVDYKLFPRPMINESNYDFSFSGLKTAVLNEIKKSKISLSNAIVGRLAAEIEEAITDVLIKKALTAIEEFKPKSFLLSGGVSANLRLREKFGENFEKHALWTALHVPVPKFCTDNASFIAAAAYYNRTYVDWRNVKALPQLGIE